MALTGRVAEGSSVAKSPMQMVYRLYFLQGDQNRGLETPGKATELPLLSGAKKEVVRALRAIRHCHFRLEAIAREGIRSLCAPMATVGHRPRQQQGRG